MTIYYVRTTGSDSNTGLSSAQALATLSYAINISAVGDSIDYLGSFYHCCVNYVSDVPATLIVGANKASLSFAAGSGSSGSIFGSTGGSIIS